MKIASLIVMAALAVTSCNGSQPPKTATETQSASKSHTVELTSAMFKNKVMDYEKEKSWKFKGDKPAVIDFYATWCGPCKMTAPIVDSLANVYQGKVDVYKVDVDKQQELAQIFGIQSIPTILFIPKTGEPTMQVGAMNGEQMESYIKQILSAK